MFTGFVHYMVAHRTHLAVLALFYTALALGRLATSARVQIPAQMQPTPFAALNSSTRRIRSEPTPVYIDVPPPSVQNRTDFRLLRLIVPSSISCDGRTRQIVQSPDTPLQARLEMEFHYV